MSKPLPHQVDDALLRAWPLPRAQPDGDKADRGRVLVIGGSREMPGAAALAGVAALRAGAGRLVIAIPQGGAQAVAAAVPEARVIALPEATDGGPSFHGLPLVSPLAGTVDAVVIGPGMVGPEVTLAFVQMVLPLFAGVPVVLDALALEAARGPTRFAQPVILTPHCGEMAHLCGQEKEQLQEQALAMASRYAATWTAVVALKGATTCIAGPDGEAWVHESFVPGLGTSGSGDVLAGLIAGLAARGAPPEQAAVWGVALHARAGQALAARHGELGYLARELAGEVPAIMARLTSVIPA